MGLTENSDFQRMLLDAPVKRRFKTCHSLPNTYYSWKHLQVQKQKHTQRKAKAHLLHTNTATCGFLWKLLIKEKIEQGVILSEDIIPCTVGADATPVPALPQYSEHRNVNVGLCGLRVPDHNFTGTLQPPERYSYNKCTAGGAIDIIADFPCSAHHCCRRHPGLHLQEREVSE